MSQDDIETSESIDARGILATVHDVRRRTRTLAHGGVWLPVAVIAALLLGSIGLYATPFAEVSSVYAPFPFWAGLAEQQRSEVASYVFWFTLTPAAFAVIAWWYRRRARRIGVNIAWRWFAVAGLGALAALAVLAAVPADLTAADATMLADPGLDVLRGLRTPILPLAAALVVLGWAERSPALALSGVWIGVLAWWFCTAGTGRLPGWLSWVLGGFQGPALGGQLAVFDRPGPVLIAMAAPLIGYALIRGLRARA